MAKEYDEHDFARQMEKLCNDSSVKAKAMQDMIFGMFEEYIIKKDEVPKSFKDVLDEETEKLTEPKKRLKVLMDRAVKTLPNHS